MSKREKSKKKGIVSLLVFLLLIIIMAGGYYYYSIKGDNKSLGDILGKTTTTTTTKKLQIIDEDSKSRPYAVMINNLGTARPLQSGLQDAYLIYEIVVEGGLTRYMALFMDTNTERIGSIRSSRHYFLDYALENDAIYVHHGQSPQAAADFSSLKIDRIVVDNSKTGWRDKTLKVSSEHTLFTSIEKLNKGLGKKRTEKNKPILLNYSIDPIEVKNIEGAKIANNISIKYPVITSSYEYDSAKGVYKRLVNGKAHIDYVTKEQYTFKNIITYQVKNGAISNDNKNRQELENIGTGKGWYITNGYAAPITWTKTSRSSQTVYKYENGEEININDGNTFIQIQPTGQSLVIE